jgi:Xaa-Pro aminopeptidase
MPENLLGTELSLVEKDRRWALLRGKLKSAGLSALIVYGGTQLGVPLHYLSLVWGSKMNMLVFPVEGEPVLLVPSNTGITGESLVRQGCWINEEDIHSSANLSVDAAEFLKKWRLDKSKVGIDSLRFWPVFEYRTFSEQCPGVELVEAHRLFGEIRGPKSSEELAIMEKAIHISDMAHYAFLSALKPGITEMEAAAAANEILDAHDIVDRIVLIHSRPEAPYPNRPGNTVIQKPNPITFSPEFTRNRGYGAQMIRGYWWHEPEGVYKRMFEMWADMRQMVLRGFRPGIEITDAGQMIEDLVDEWGFECDKLGHAVGLSYGDAPYITAGSHERDYMPWTILAGEVYAVHPMVRAKGGTAPFTMVGDMYHIGKECNRWMTAALPGLPEIIPQ